MRNRSTHAQAAGALLMGAIACAHAGDAWPTLGGNGARSLTAADAPPLDLLRWTLTHDQWGDSIEWIGQAPPVIAGGRVFALGSVGIETRLFAVRLDDGGIDWDICVDPQELDSWAGPVLDEANGTVIVASGFSVEAFDQHDGTPLWFLPLDRAVVNATPVVTTDRGPNDRVLVTDFDGGGTAARLYAINVDPYHPAVNPYKPGEIVWSVGIGGASGASPTYADGFVYVATIGQAFIAPGSLRKFKIDPAVTHDPPPLWTYTLPVTQGFFGGLSLHNGSLYAATFAFFGGQNAARLVRVDASTGSHKWIAPANRTNAVPIVIEQGADPMIALASGIAGFGSLPAVQLFTDLGSMAVQIADTALDTFIDTNGNMAPDAGEYTALGGWTHHPVSLTAPLAPMLLTGEPEISGASDFEPHVALRVINLAQHPASGAFIDDSSPHGGGSPAVTSDCVVSVGATGLAAFGLCGAPADRDGNGELDIEDLYKFNADPADLTGDGLINDDDRRFLQRTLRHRELDRIAAPIFEHTGAQP